MIRYDIEACIGSPCEDAKPVQIKKHDTGVRLAVHLVRRQQVSKWRAEKQAYLIPELSAAIVRVRKPDGTKYESDKTVIEGRSTVVHCLEVQGCTSAGICEAEIVLYDTEQKRLTSATFRYEITAECVCDDDPPSKDYFDILGEQIQQVADAAASAHEAIVATNNAAEAAILAEEAAQEAQSAAELAKEGAKFSASAAEKSANRAEAAAESAGSAVNEALEKAKASGEFDGADGEPSYVMPPWYRGVDLTEKFADEIAKYKNPWKWIRERIRAGNYDGLHICDYIPFERTNNGQRFEAQIAGIDTYYGYGDTNAEVGHHIDFITREAVGWGRRINQGSTNNGNADTPYPWLASELYSVLNGTGDFQYSGLWDQLPYELQQYIVEKPMKLEQRYYNEYLLAEDNAAGWTNIGKLWLPAEFEVYGSGICNKGRASTGATAVQYPIFVGNCNNRTKRVANGTRVAWWLLNPVAGSTDYWCCVSNRGNADSTPVTNTYTFPICFRIA